MSEDYEVLYHRAREGARGARVGLERALRRLRQTQAAITAMRLEITYERARRWKAEAENKSLTNKVERLSLRIIDLWGREQGIMEESDDARKQDG